MSSCIKTSSGSIKKQVKCERCAYAYEYEMRRTAVGTASDSSRYVASEKAAIEAKEKLDKLLQTECDVVPCPECGAITAEMKKAKYSFLWDMPLVVAMGMAILIVVALFWFLTGGIYVFGAAAGVVLILVGCLVFAVRGVQLVFARPSRRR